jgi:hypothetical protein
MIITDCGKFQGGRLLIHADEWRQPVFDVVGIGLNAVDCLVGLPRFPVQGEKLRMSAFAREGGGQVATALVALSRVPPAIVAARTARAAGVPIVLDAEIGRRFDPLKLPGRSPPMAKDFLPDPFPRTYGPQ